MTKADGTHATVYVDASFNVVSVETGGPGGPGGFGGHDHHGGPGRPARRRDRAHRRRADEGHRRRDRQGARRDHRPRRDRRRRQRRLRGAHDEGRRHARHGLRRQELRRRQRRDALGANQRRQRRRQARRRACLAAGYCRRLLGPVADGLDVVAVGVPFVRKLTNDCYTKRPLNRAGFGPGCPRCGCYRSVAIDEVKRSAPLPQESSGSCSWPWRAPCVAPAQGRNGI